MSKKRGVSAEEKRTRVLELFYEKKDFFQLKELEKIAPKEKGVIAQSVKDVVQSLVDDGLVDSEKIGTSIYFWAYPSKAKHTKERQLAQLTDKLISVKKQLDIGKVSLETARIGKEETEERVDLLKRLAELKAKKEELTKEIKKFEDEDPEILEQMEKDVEKYKEAANRWTDNIFSIKSWCKNKFGIEGDALDKQFGIPENLDYLD